MSDAWVTAWNPALYSPGKPSDKLFLLPLPVPQVDITWPWRSTQHEPEGGRGGVTHGISQRPATIDITGQLCVQDGDFTVTQADMWSVVEGLRAFIATQSDANRLEFFIWHDSVASVYRKFKQVSVVNFTTNLGDDNARLWTYSLNLLADDPQLYNTAPGA